MGLWRSEFCWRAAPFERINFVERKTGWASPWFGVGAAGTVVQGDSGLAFSCSWSMHLLMRDERASPSA